MDTKEIQDGYYWAIVSWKESPLVVEKRTNHIWICGSEFELTDDEEIKDIIILEQIEEPISVKLWKLKQ